DAGRTGLAGPDPLAVAAGARALADGAHPPPLEGSQRRGPAMAGAARQRLAAGADHLSGRLAFRRHRLPALRVHAHRSAMRLVELSEARRCAKAARPHVASSEAVARPAASRSRLTLFRRHALCFGCDAKRLFGAAALSRSPALRSPA